MSSDSNLRNQLQGYSQSDDALINTQAQLTYRMCSFLSFRKKMLDVIENGTSEEKKKRQESIGIKVDQMDPEEDAISKDVLLNWKSLTKETKMAYCRYIASQSISIQSDIMVKKEEFKLAVKGRLSKFFKKNNAKKNGKKSNNSK